MTATHVRAGEGRDDPLTSDDRVARAVVQDSAGSFEVFEVVTPAAEAAPPHVSSWSGVLHPVEGQVRALVSHTSYDVKPVDQPVATSPGAILSRTRHHSEFLVGV